ncbi:MAG: hypothetical protein KJO95_08125 [Gammaproteobacteria bacterium]|nr:hypothetical protein [Gammaproteobacteria bacterium]NNC56679.1 hypothetical protein [Woeseiaceae bacterium]
MFRNIRGGHNQEMDASIYPLALYLIAAAFLGVGVGWLVRREDSRRRLARKDKDWQEKLDAKDSHIDRLAVEVASLLSSIEDQQAVARQYDLAVAKGRTDLESAHAKEKLMSKDLFNLRAEREDFKRKVVTFQKALDSVRQQSADIQKEFIKSREVYKRELAKTFEKRKVLEMKVENARLERESFSNLMQATRSEHESVNKMLDSARKRLENLDELERNVIALEADNAQLSHDAIRIRQENDALRRDVSDLTELRIQNQELTHCLKSMENSRKQFEEDANRYRDTAGQYEQHSDTLRLRLDEVEKNLSDIEMQQNQALQEARQAEVGSTQSDAQSQSQQDIDNLQDIVGIGKVFEQTLHDLGIYSFQQIAEFDAADISRVNAAMQEFKGRMEQDDWIGQARELRFKKYGGSSNP